MSMPKFHGPQERGGYLVEFALGLPVVLLLIFIVIWISVILHARSTLTVVLGQALRLAATRGDSSLVGTDIIPDIQAWTGDPAQVAPPASLNQFLASPDLEATTYWDYYNTVSLDPVFGGVAGTSGSVRLNETQPEYIYALVYFNQSLRQSIGPTVRFPCDPTLADGSGCVSCVFLNPNSLFSNAVGPQDPWDTAVDGPIPRRRLGMECQYRPSSVFLDPVVKLLRIIAGPAAISPIIITRTKYHDAPG